MELGTMVVLSRCFHSERGVFRVSAGHPTVEYIDFPRCKWFRYPTRLPDQEPHLTPGIDRVQTEPIHYLERTGSDAVGSTHSQPPLPVVGVLNRSQFIRQITGFLG